MTRSWPWAGILALLTIFLLDATVLGVRGPWHWIHGRIEPVGTVYEGVAHDRTVFRDLAVEEDARPRVFIMGTSRARRAIRSSQAETAAPDVRFARFNHPMMDLFTIRSLVPEVLDAGADGVLLMLSHFDTHRPLRLEPLPARSSARPALFLELMRDAGLRFGWDNRGSLYRLIAARTLNGYRLRESLALAGLDRLRHFELDGRLQGLGARPNLRSRPALGEPVLDLDLETKRMVAREIRPELHRFLKQANWIAETRLGEHARVQLGLLRRLVDELVEAGVWVVIVETPLHPIAESLQQAGTREEFLRVARELDRREEVHFVPIPANRPFGRRAFHDLLHVNGLGALRLTDVSVRAVVQMSKLRSAGSMSEHDR
jgi:hypothetical protein